MILSFCAGSSPCAGATEILADLRRFQHRGDSSEFFPATLAASAGQFSCINAAPSRVVYPAHMSFLEESAERRSAWALGAGDFLRNLLRDLLRFGAIGWNGS